MKTIKVRLTAGGIHMAIRSLEAYKRQLERKTERLVELLTRDGAEAAQQSFGGMASVTHETDGTTGRIEASGKEIIIAEFGAGLSTMEDHPMADNAPVPVERWSYSLLAGSGEGWQNAQNGYIAPGETEPGYWVFGGRIMSRVEPRHGLLDAKTTIESELEDVARGVFK